MPGNLVGGAIAGGVEGAIKGIGGVMDQLFTSDDERLSHGEVMARIKQAPQLAQIALNSIEAAHRTVFVAGWRPFVGWVCGFALAYHFVLRDLIAWSFKVAEGFGAPVIVPPPPVSIMELVSILVAMLGMAAYRTNEKKAGVAS